MQWTEIGVAFGILATTIGGFWGMFKYYGMASKDMIEKFEQRCNQITEVHEKEIEAIRIELDRKIGRTYERLDEVKDHADKCFVSKEMCNQMHNATATSLVGLETRMNESFKEVKASVKDMGDKVNNTLTKILLLVPKLSKEE
jgi:DNA anti-recombination protein RmuC